MKKRKGLFWPALSLLIGMGVLLRLLGSTPVFPRLALALSAGGQAASPAELPGERQVPGPEPGRGGSLPARESWLSAESAFPRETAAISDAEGSEAAAVLPEAYIPAAGREEAPGERPLPRVHNAGKRTPDYRALLEEGWGCSLQPGVPQILILHSHGCEAYRPTPEDPYEESEAGRTYDKDHSVIRVGEVLARELEARGFQVLHDREAYDAAGYTGAYERSRAAAEAWLEENPELRVVIDLHRDALGGSATSWVTPEGEASAQVMLLVGSGEAGLYHPHWLENLRLGLQLQQEMEARAPGLARPLYLSTARYNQHLSPGFFILEVGSDANTLQEAITAVTAFAGCAARVLGEYLS